MTWSNLYLGFLNYDLTFVGTFYVNSSDNNIHTISIVEYKTSNAVPVYVTSSIIIHLKKKLGLQNCYTILLCTAKQINK